MSLSLIAAIALLTYASRALALVVMPDPPPRAKAVLDRIPAPLFAALAAISVVADDQIAAPVMLCAVFGALLATPTRSLLYVLFGGLAGYALGAFVFS